MEELLGCLIPFIPLKSEWHRIPTISLIFCKNMIDEKVESLCYLGSFQWKLKPQTVLSQPEIIPV